MDGRVRRHAEVLVDHCTAVESTDDVLVRAPTAAEDLVVALYERLGDRGARVTTEWRNPRATRAYLRAVDPDDLRTADHDRAQMADTDVVILVKAARNAAETGDVDPEVAAAARRARRPVLEERLDARWVITQHPTPADAQRAEMSTDAWAAFVHDAVDRDWERLAARGRRLADAVEAADELRVVAGDTDLRLSVAEMGVYVDDGTENLPGGEVATVPVVDGVDGRLVADHPVRRDGRAIRGADLQFADGEVVDYAADAGEPVLEALLETDPGARRVGELGIGTNRGIDRVTGNALFDEKAAGTVHVGLGEALAECVPEGRELNESAAHADLVVDLGDGRVLADGDPVWDGEVLV